MDSGSYVFRQLAGLICSATITISSAAGQTAWTEQFPSQSPSARTAHGLVYHQKLQRTVLFGGGVNTGGTFNDTWVWDGTNWSQLAIPNAPPPRYGHSMVYDSDRHVIVVFGGGDVARNLYRDTWEFDGVSWFQRASTGPSPRWNHGMAYDPIRKKTVLFGGNNLTRSFGDTWEWDGSRWREMAATSPPPPRMGPAMAFDGTTGKIILAGGYGWGASFLVDSGCWLWDGQRWWDMGLSPVIAGHYSAAMTWDESRQRVVKFGGVTLFSGVGYLNQSIEWTPGWSRRAMMSSPTERAWSPLAYDAVRRKVVMFGGSNSVVLGDTQEYGAVIPATVTSFGAGCAGSAGVPSMAVTGGLPWLRERVSVTVNNLAAGSPTVLAFGASNSTWGARSLPYSLGQLAPGCDVLASQEGLLPLVNAAGVAATSIGIPPNPAVAGVSLYLQGFTLDPVNPLGMTLSNALDLRIGSK